MCLSLSGMPQVIAQCEKYVREIGPGIIIFRYGYVKCPLTSPTGEVGFRFCDWKDRPRGRGEEGAGGLEWQSRYRLMQSTEIGFVPPANLSLQCLGSSKWCILISPNTSWRVRSTP